MDLMPRKIYLDDIFDDFISSKKEPKMKCDIYEKGNNYHIEMDIPGFDKNEISVETKNGYLIQDNEIPFTLEYKGQEVDIYEKNMDYLDIRQKFNLNISKTFEKSIYEGLLKDAYKDVQIGVYTREALKDYAGKEVIAKKEEN